MSNFITHGFEAYFLRFFRLMIGGVVFMSVNTPLAISSPAARDEGARSWQHDYLKSPDFKAVAMARPAGALPLIIRFSYKYDTARAAYKAAIAYCEEARNEHSSPKAYKPCRGIGLGSRNISTVEPSDSIFESYEDQILKHLHADLALTNNRETRTVLSTILQKTGQYEASEKLLYKLAMNGEDLAQNALAYHWAELQKNLTKALKLADSAIRQRPDFFSFHDTRALVLLRLGRIEDAVKAAEKAVSLKTHPIALDHLGDIYWIAEKKEKARQQWALAIANSIDILFKKRVRRKITTGLKGDPVFE